MEKIQRGKVDYFLLVVIILLFGIGMSILFSASYNHAEKLGKNPFYFFNKQIIWLAVGGFLAFILARAPLDLLRKGVPLVLIFAFLTSLLPFIPGLGKEINGARRWIFFFNYSFQPSEFVKLALILYLASILNKKEHKIDDPINTLLPPLLIVSIFVAIIFLQSDLSTAVLVFLVAISMFYMAKIKLIYFFYVATVILPIGIIILFTKSYWVERLMAFIDPNHNPQGIGYQILASKISLMSGGLAGKGLGIGMLKQRIPEADSDFIFSVAGEETGFIGLFLIIILFILFAYRGFIIASKSKDSFAFLLAFGITASIVFQALLNMFVVAGLLPTAGIPLPFFSHGGSSFIVTLIMCGLLVNLSRNIDSKEGASHG